MDLNQTEIALLGEAQRSNGGGIRYLPSNGKAIGKLVTAGLLAPKKGNVTTVELYVITRAGRLELLARQQAEQNARNDQIARQPEVFRNVVDHVERINAGARPEVVVLGGRRVGKTEAIRQFYDTPLAPPVYTPPFHDDSVIDVDFREIKDCPADGQDQTPCDPPWSE